MKAGNITGYWPPCADETARTHGYRPVSECDAAIAAGTAGPCHSGESGLVDYGIVEWGDDDIVSINGKRTLSGYVFMLEDAIFGCPRLHLWKSDVSVSRRGRRSAVWGLEIDPGDRDHPYRSISSIREDARSRSLILTLDDGTGAFLTPFPSSQAVPSVISARRNSPSSSTSTGNRRYRARRPCRTLDAPAQSDTPLAVSGSAQHSHYGDFPFSRSSTRHSPHLSAGKKCCNRHFFPEINVDVDTFFELGR